VARSERRLIHLLPIVLLFVVANLISRIVTPVGYHRRLQSEVGQLRRPPAHRDSRWCSTV